MAPNLGGWIHTFTVTDTQTHKGGYTIYKITSIVFPRAIPEALTCLVVWKRFHDVKRLHRELSKRHKNLQLPGKVPEPTDASYFKRFDGEVIEKRKRYILQLLDFAAQYPVLYKCHPFTSFFSDINSPNDSPLHRLHVEHSIHFKQNKNEKSPSSRRLLQENEKDVENDLSKENSIESSFCFVSMDNELSFIEPQLNDKHEDNAQENNQKALLQKHNQVEKQNNENAKNVGILEKEVVVEIIENEKKENSLNFAENENHINGLQSNEAVIEKETKAECNRSTKEFSNVLTPMASIESDDSDYIYEAALEFSHAVQAEVNQNYKEAHQHYKLGVEVLLNGSKDDSNEERKFIAETKITKYSSRVDDIYERFLKDTDQIDGARPKKINFQLSVEDDSQEKSALALEKPWNILSKYKVISILGGNCVMKVESLIENDQQSFYVMKGIEKPSTNSPTQSIFLPQNVPYMIDLLGYFQSEEKIFLLLRYAEGGLLFDHIKNYCPILEKRQGYADLFPEITPSEESYEICSTSSVQDSGYVEAPAEVEEAEEYTELVKNSQELIQSVSKTLNQIKNQNESEINNKKSSSEEKNQINHIQIPEVSLKQWISELVVAIHFLHEKGIILKDLHMENLLLGSKGQLLVTYFYQNEGPAFEDSYVHKSLNMKAINGHFVAPERPLTFKSDWWSFGIILYQLLTGVPFKTMHPGNIDLYASVQYPENVEISDSARDLIENLIQHNNEDRFDFEHIQKHNFLKGINWKLLETKGSTKKTASNDS